MESPTKTKPQALQSLDRFSELLDSRFRIPGTSISFGVDFLVGLVPYAGDLLGFLFSAGLLVIMVRHGASGQVAARMLLNIVLDTLIGSIPVLGDIFDLFYKANRRNYRLLEEHYEEGAYQGSLWRVLLPILLVLVLVFVLTVWLVFEGLVIFLDFVF